jgi:hypothetical protein
MRIVQCIAAIVALLAGSGAPAHAYGQNRLVFARLVQSGYARRHGVYVLGPEGTDQVWAEWTFWSCRGERGQKTYMQHMLVHSVVFPRPGGIYRLTVSPEGEVESVARIREREGGKC